MKIPEHKRKQKHQWFKDFKIFDEIGFNQEVDDAFWIPADYCQTMLEEIPSEMTFASTWHKTF